MRGATACWPAGRGADVEPRDGRSVFVLGLGSDIGAELGKRFQKDGWAVYGTYRRGPVPAEFAPARTFPCDVSDPASVARMAEACRATGLRWDVFIGAVGTEEPIGHFFECDIDEWEASVRVNALGLLRALHALHPLRASGRECACVLFAGAGTNDAAVRYSAYSASKIFLIKMCELLAAENPDLNPVIVGPGIVRTKIHEQTIRAGARAGANYDRVVRFLDGEDGGVSHDDVYACVTWCLQAGRLVTGGRNVSLVHDAWRDGGEPLRAALASDPDMYRLRRSGNAWEAPGR